MSRNEFVNEVLGTLKEWWLPVVLSTFCGLWLTAIIAGILGALDVPAWLVVVNAIGAVTLSPLYAGYMFRTLWYYTPAGREGDVLAAVGAALSLLLGTPVLLAALFAAAPVTLGALYASWAFEKGKQAQK